MTSAVADPERDAELTALRADPELAEIFIAEALDHLGTIEAAVLQLEAAPGDVRLLNDIFRPFHTVKGNAGALGVVSIQQLAHKTESLLDLARSGKVAVGVAETDAVLQSVDLLKTMVGDLRVRLAGQTPRDLTSERQSLVETLDRLIAGGATAPATGTAAPVAVADSAGPHVTPADAQSTPFAAPAAVKVDTRKLDNLVDMVGELVIVQSIIQADHAVSARTDDRLSRSLSQLRLITSELQRNAMSLRMVPIRATFQKVARLVRDVSRICGKPVDLLLAGENTELDRKVVEDISDPLAHMVRNSIDHGLERPADRVAAGKPETGRLVVSAYHEGGNIVIAIGDDGAGLDTDRILRVATERGLVGPGDSLSPAEIHELIFEPGFSTAAQVTEISGRGVGMDVVRRNIQALRGRVELETSAGRGTTFFIKLPLTLAIVDGLVLRVGAERFILPTYAACESLRPAADQVHRMQGRSWMVKVRDAVLPLFDLAALLGVPRDARPAAEGTVVVVESDGRKVALLVDELVGKQEVVIKPLGAVFAGLEGVSGGAILGDGRIGLILDAASLIALTGREPGRAA